MRIIKFSIAMQALLLSLEALAQSPKFLAVPAASFTPRNSTTVEKPLRGTLETLGYSGNASGTARFFGDNSAMFAPISLPHGATVLSLECAGAAPRLSRRIIFHLRRNQPQQANVDMATVATDFPVTAFQFKSTTSIQSPVIDNRRFNYYIAAELGATNDVPECRTCFVNRCTIGYTGP
jgi:hypothetical protein